MLRAVLLALTLTATFLYSSTSGKSQPVPGASGWADRSVSFTKNIGQWDSPVLYRGDISGAAVWFCEDRIVYQMLRRPEMARASGVFEHEIRAGAENDSVEQIIVTAKFLGADWQAANEGEHLQDDYFNFFLGNDSTRWRSHVPRYAGIVFRDVYPGIDIRFYGNADHQLEFDVMAAPQADLDQVQICFEGISALATNSHGDLVTRDRGIVLAKHPVVHAQSKSTAPISAEFHMLDSLTCQINLDDRYDPSLPVIIDPVINFASYLGGYDTDLLVDMTIGPNGNLYLVGFTASADFPQIGPMQSYAGLDGFVVKLDLAGSKLVYSSFYGGSNIDKASAISVDKFDVIYMAGMTHSEDLPLANPYQDMIMGASDCFLAKFNSEGDMLSWSTYFGGSGEEDPGGLGINAGGDVIFAGWTTSPDLPLSLALQAYQGGYDAFLAAFSGLDHDLVHSTYLGGSSDELFYDFALDSAGQMFLTGYTTSPDFPATNPGFGPAAYPDVFVTKYSADGLSYVFSTRIGGGGYDSGHGVAAGDDGCAYVTGLSFSWDFPLVNPIQSFVNHSDAFVFKLSADGNNLLYCTQLGSPKWDVGNAIAVDKTGCAYVTGYSSGSGMAIVNQAQDYAGATDAFVAKLSPAGNYLVYSTYLGGSYDDFGWAVTVDSLDRAWVGGRTTSDDFPLRIPFQDSFGGYEDAFVVRLGNWSCGDADGNELVSVSDAVFVIGYVFAGGSAPDPIVLGDANCDGLINISDAVLLINFIFAGGPLTCIGCR